jgi:hypothetical protein
MLDADITVKCDQDNCDHDEIIEVRTSHPFIGVRIAGYVIYGKTTIRRYCKLCGKQFNPRVILHGKA